MDMKEIEERWKDKKWFPVNPHKDVMRLISRVKELEVCSEHWKKSTFEFKNLAQQLEASNVKLNESRQLWKDNCQTLEDTRLKLEADNHRLREAIRLLRRGLREEADRVLEE